MFKTTLINFGRAFFFCGALALFGGGSNPTIPAKSSKDESKINYNAVSNFVYCHELHTERLDTLSRTMFWRRMMNTSKDTFVFYAAPEKVMLASIPAATFDAYSDEDKEKFKDSLRTSNNYECDKRIMYAMGRNHFYNVESVIDDIRTSTTIFKKNGVDPFYAQAILLIESPGKLAKSSVGAYGPFQLMKSVAIANGLKVNSKIDERKDLEKSAVGAGNLITRVCIPYTNKMLTNYNIAWCETDLWYRLLVLHVYHAGAGNVAKALNIIQPEVGNMNLIKQLWLTNAGGFQNASQNYSQVALASLFELENYLSRMPQSQVAEN